MFNVTIINAKGSIKKIAILIVTLILLFIVTRFIQNLKSTEDIRKFILLVIQGDKTIGARLKLFQNQIQR